METAQPPLDPGLLPDDLAGWFNLALWMVTLAHCCILAAGAMVPFKLKWADDFTKLEPFNRKIFRVYYAYIATTILAMGLATFFLHDAMLAGDREALVIVLYGALFWTARIIIDAVYFKHSDWPKGPGFLAGHILLTSTFIAVAGVYWGLIAWHL